eukprot:XP_001709177.1 Hypothetical protein GL50803_37204 [Giardia lamblia ATCC 50803]
MPICCSSHERSEAFTKLISCGSRHSDLHILQQFDTVSVPIPSGKHERRAALLILHTSLYGKKHAAGLQIPLTCGKH